MSKEKEPQKPGVVPNPEDEKPQPQGVVPNPEEPADPPADDESDES